MLTTLKLLHDDCSKYKILTKQLLLALFAQKCQKKIYPHLLVASYAKISLHFTRFSAKIQKKNRVQFCSTEPKPSMSNE